jgi:hypothetical protein
MDDVLMEQAEQVAPQAAPQQQQQPMLTQDQVNKIVAREKQRAAEAARREMEERIQAQEQRNTMVSRDADVAGIYQQVQERFNMEQDRLRKELEEKQLKEHMNQVANNYLSRVDAAKGSYQDFEDVTKDFDASAFPQLVYLLSGMDNAGHVLYDLSKNPLKLAAIDRLAERNPKQAQSELNKLSQSIILNQQAQEQAPGQSTADPLDRLQPSKIAGENGKMGIKDLRQQSWLKG